MFRFLLSFLKETMQAAYRALEKTNVGVFLPF